MVAGLPYDAEVEYLESTGTQYLGTRWLPRSNNIRVRFKAQSTGVFSKAAICGSEGGNIYATWTFVIYAQTDNKAYPLTGRWNKTSSFTFQPGDVLDIDWTSTNYSTTCTDLITGTSLKMSFSGVADYTRNVNPLNLFCNKTTQRSKIKMFYYKIYDAESLVRDLIPVRFTNEQGVSEGAMYDRLGVGGMNPGGFARNDGLYRNRGTGAFVLGPDV